MTPLEQYPALRQFLCSAQWLVNLALGIVGIVFVALGRSPMWLAITVACFNFVWTYTGTIAARNVSPAVVAPADVHVEVQGRRPRAGVRLMPTSHGPAFRWFAWRPVWTEDRGWRWLRPVWRRRFYLDLGGHPAMAWFVHAVDRPLSG